MLQTLYPEYKWIPWKLNPVAFVDDFQNRKIFFDVAAKTLKVQKLADWYQVTKDVVHFINLCHD